MSGFEVRRRAFVGSSVTATLLGFARPLPCAKAAPDEQGVRYQLYCGDLHNHNAVGYATGSLQRDNAIYFTGPFTAESFMLGRLVGPSESSTTIRWHDHRAGRTEADWYDVRVLQHNNPYGLVEPRLGGLTTST